MCVEGKTERTKPNGAKLYETTRTYADEKRHVLMLSITESHTVLICARYTINVRLNHLQRCHHWELCRSHFALSL